VEALKNFLKTLIYFRYLQRQLQMCQESGNERKSKTPLKYLFMRYELTVSFRYVKNEDASIVPYSL